MYFLILKLWTVLYICAILQLLPASVNCHLTSDPMTEEERLGLKEEAREMFYHAYNAYMENAYPADELLPLTCGGRYRDPRFSRGDIDDVLGNFSLTLVDTLDTLVVLGDLHEFERAIKLIIQDVSFDTDVIVSVFETNIRMLGGLLSGHVLVEHLNQLYGVMSWYRGELLVMAQDLATRLLPAFNTTTGIPHPRVNLRHGMQSPLLQHSRDTCTSCAGTMILEFAALSRLTGLHVFEEKARKTLDYLWQQRHRGSDLVGTVLNVHSGDWIRRDSGVGAGIDSYYEYLLKAYVLFGDYDYLHRFNKHYTAVMKYVSQGPMLLDVHMHRPHTTTRNYMDAFLAFWPGLQVLKGDIKPAIETHEMLYQVIQRHNFLPEAFTTDFQVHWGQHPLRPEFVESTYLLYEATEDPYYLRVGREALRALQRHAWVPCGYAAVKDVRTGGHEDRMDSFVLSETFKYLYLLFSKPDELPITLDDFVFTTEAHLLPLSLAGMSNNTLRLSSSGFPLLPTSAESINSDDSDFSRSCPNAHSLFPGKQQFAENIRKPLKNYVESVCPNRLRTLGPLGAGGGGAPLKRKLRASEFQAGNEKHAILLRSMGITMQGMSDGRVQLLHSADNAATPEDSEEGMVFMQEMIELSNSQQEQPENPPKSVIFAIPADLDLTRSSSHGGDYNWSLDGDIIIKTLTAGHAQFGKQLTGDEMVEGKLVVATPYRACEALTNGDDVKGNIVVLERGDCMFIEKARVIQRLGAIGGIVVDNAPAPAPSSGTSDNLSDEGGEPPMFAMSGDNTADDVTIPMLFLFAGPAQELLYAYRASRGRVSVVLADMADKVAKLKGDLRNVVANLQDKKQDDDASAATRQAMLAFKAKEWLGSKGENTCSDDLVTLVSSGGKIPEDSSGFDSLKGSALLKDEEQVVLAPDVSRLLEALRGYVRGSSGRRGKWLAQRVQYLLTWNSLAYPQSLRALLATYIVPLQEILGEALSVNSEDSDDDKLSSMLDKTNVIQNVIQGLLEELSVSEVTNSEPDQVTQCEGSGADEFLKSLYKRDGNKDKIISTSPNVDHPNGDSAVIRKREDSQFIPPPPPPPQPPSTTDAERHPHDQDL